MCRIMIILDNYNIESKLNQKYGHSRSGEKFTGLIVVGLPETGTRDKKVKHGLIEIKMKEWLLLIKTNSKG